MARISWTAERVLTAVLRKNEMGELPAKIGVCAAGTGYADCPYQTCFIELPLSGNCDECDA